MSYKVSFGDASPEGAFFAMLEGYVVQIGTSEETEADYMVLGPMSYDGVTHMPTLLVALYDEVEGTTTGPPIALPLTGEESIHVY